MEEIVTVKPVAAAKDGLEGVVKEYDGYFTGYGWGLRVNGEYTRPERDGVAEALYLQKMK